MGRPHQIDLSPLCHTLLCVCRGFSRVGLGNFGFDSGLCGKVSETVFAFWIQYAGGDYLLLSVILQNISRRAFSTFTSLDKCFENVCELDLIFHSDRVHYCLGEPEFWTLLVPFKLHCLLTGALIHFLFYHFSSLNDNNYNNNNNTARRNSYGGHGSGNEY